MADIDFLEVLRLRLQGFTYPKITDEIGFSGPPDSLRKKFARYIRKHHKRDELVERLNSARQGEIDFHQIADLRRKGMSFVEITDAIGYSKTSDNLRMSFRNWERKSAIESIEPEYEVDVDEFATEYEEDTVPEAYDKPGFNLSDMEVSQSYHFIESRETYIVNLKSRPSPLEVPKKVHDQIINAYSNWDGQSATLNELSRQFGLPRTQFVEYMRVFGVTKDKEPVSTEDFLSDDYDEEMLVENTLSRRRISFFQKYEKRKWRDIIDAAERMWELEKYTLEPLLGMIAEALPSYKPPKLKLQASGESNNAVVISTSDMHIGMHAWGGESASEWSVDIAKNLILEKFQAILTHVTNYDPQKIFFVIGSDFLHIDNLQKSTTSGTPQDVDGAFAKIIFEGVELALNFVDLLRQIAPVEVYMAAGNHDRIHSWNLLLTMHHVYKEANDVNVVVDGSFRQYAVFGDVLMGFTHGDGPKKGKLGSLMAHEARSLWGQTSQHIWFQGHLHHEETLDIDGVIIYQLPTLIPSDRWHTKSGYTTARRAMAAYVINAEKGVIAQITEPA